VALRLRFELGEREGERERGRERVAGNFRGNCRASAKREGNIFFLSLESTAGKTSLVAAVARWRSGEAVREKKEAAPFPRLGISATNILPTGKENDHF